MGGGVLVFFQATIEHIPIPFLKYNFHFARETGGNNFKWLHSLITFESSKFSASWPSPVFRTVTNIFISIPFTNSIIFARRFSFVADVYCRDKKRNVDKLCTCGFKGFSKRYRAADGAIWSKKIN